MASPHRHPVTQPHSHRGVAKPSPLAPIVRRRRQRYPETSSLVEMGSSSSSLEAPSSPLLALPYPSSTALSLATSSGRSAARPLSTRQPPLWEPSWPWPASPLITARRSRVVLWRERGR